MASYAISSISQATIDQARCKALLSPARFDEVFGDNPSLTIVTTYGDLTIPIAPPREGTLICFASQPAVRLCGVVGDDKQPMLLHLYVSRYEAARVVIRSTWDEAVAAAARAANVAVAV